MPVAPQRGLVFPDFAEAFAWRIRIHRASVNGKTVGHRHSPSTTRNLAGIRILAAIVSYLGFHLTGCFCGGDEGSCDGPATLSNRQLPERELRRGATLLRRLRRRPRCRLTRRLTRRLSRR